MPTTRFAPSPTGYLHLGHAFSALTAQAAAGPNGRFLVRIEDIDQARARPEFEAAILEDLAWLGLKFEQPVRRQSAHFGDYAQSLARLTQMGVTYPCFCTRGRIAAEIAAAGDAPQGPDGPLYPGTCRALSAGQRAERLGMGERPAIRLDAARAADMVGPLVFHEQDHIIAVDPVLLGDIVLARRDAGIAYHLAVVHDDDVQGVDLVTRGHDLLPATHVQRVLQALLGYDAPTYAHHRLICDSNGTRLAKRNGSKSLRDLIRGGLTLPELRRHLELD
jgi:glutamyl-Q tRNA(Asp) synthetase